MECSGVDDFEDCALPWKYERISVTVREDGTVVYLQYTSPYELAETVAQETKLLPFSEIQSVFESLATVPYRHIKDGGDASNRHYTLTEVRLGLMRITEVNKRDAGRLIPVWDFIAEYTSAGDQPKSGVVLTIHAMDGSIIERKMGY